MSLNAELRIMVDLQNNKSNPAIPVVVIVVGTLL
jgi:hypothetical protein